MNDETALRKFIDSWRTRIEIVLDERNRIPFIVGVIFMGAVWAWKDGRVFTYLNDALRVDCFSVPGYPAGRWDYTTQVLNAFKPFEFKNHLILQSPQSGRVPSDTCVVSHGTFNIIAGTFDPNEVLDTTYRDGCDNYCSRGSLEVSRDGCSLAGSSAGYQKCPSGFPNVSMEGASQQTESVFEWKERRPFIFELWAY